MRWVLGQTSMALRVTAVLFTHSMDRHRIALILKAIAIATTSEVKRHRRPRVRPSVVRRPSCSDSDDRGEIMLRCGISSGSLRSPIWPSISLSALLLRPSPGAAPGAARRHHHRTRPTPTRPRPPRRHHCTGCFAVVRVCSTVVGLIARRIGNLRRAAL